MTFTESHRADRSSRHRVVVLAVVTMILLAVAVLTAGAPPTQEYRRSPTPAPAPMGALPAAHPTRTDAILIR